MKELDFKTDYYDLLKEDEIVVTENGDYLVTVDGLMRVAMEHTDFVGYKTNVVQVPEKKNDWSATATVTIKFASGFIFSGSADARCGTMADGFKSYSTALAETRALGRALRRALHIRACTEEEISDEERPITDIQKNLIKKQFVDKDVIDIRDIYGIIGRDISTIGELTEKEAVLVIDKANKKIGKTHKKNSK